MVYNEYAGNKTVKLFERIIIIVSSSRKFDILVTKTDAYAATIVIRQELRLNICKNYHTGARLSKFR